MFLTLLHSERPKLYTILAFLSAIGLKRNTENFLNFHWFPFLSRSINSEIHLKFRTMHKCSSQCEVLVLVSVCMELTKFFGLRCFVEWALYLKTIT